MQLIIKKSFITLIFIIFLFTQNKLYPSTKEINIEDFGIISIMYHRFNENKYPSTNIKMNIFKDHIRLIKESKYNKVSG